MRTLLSRTGLCLVLLSAPALTQSPSQPSTTVHLHYAQFDPATATPQIPVLLRGDERTNLWIVQFQGRPTDRIRDAIRAEGGQVHGYLPENAHVVRMSHAVAADVRQNRSVRSVTYHHPVFRLEPFLWAELARGFEAPRRRYNIVVVDKHRDKAPLMVKIRALGGVVEHEQPGSLLLEVSLNGAQLAMAARLDEVLWIDRWTPNELDMNNGRIQGGGNYVETKGGYTGKGINGHVYEGIEAGHKDFTNKGTNVLSCGSAASHGHCTAGIIFGNGKSHKDARGMAPDAKPFYTTYNCVTSGNSRWQVVRALVNTHQVMFTSASWGGARTTAYTSISADTDDIIFDHDMPWTQSQSNAGNRASRPQAWAKNIFSIGGVAHRNNSNPADDSWRAGNGSTGPAADGRIKPDLCAYYDWIMTSDRTGSAGYNRNGDFYDRFGGTSGATPMVAGHNALAIQMFTDGLFSPKRVANGTRFQNRPHFTTLKALQIANASQYPFTSSSTDNRREHVGWGFPNLQSMYDNRAVHYVVDETDLLKQDTGMAYTIRIQSGQPELKVSMCYADPAANPAATLTRINDLTLRVTAPGGTAYWGNNGLTQGNYSVAGGAANKRDTVENVFIKSPAAGIWKVEVIAYLVAQDSHVETTVVDADFGLVVNGGTFVSKAPITVAVGSFIAFGKACPGNGLAKRVCQAANENAQFRFSTSHAGVTYAVEVVASQNLNIEGYEMQNQSGSGSAVNLATLLYDADTAGRPNQVLATGTMTVGTSVAWYKTTFNKKVSVKQGQKYFLAFVNASPTGTRLGTMNTGSIVPYWRNNGSGGSWIRLTTRAWAYRTICTASAGGAVPVLGSIGSPDIGAKLTFTVRQALPGATVIFLMGNSKTTWSGLQLPWAIPGATGCSIFAAGQALVYSKVNALGSLDLSFTIPFDKGLIGRSFYNQVGVQDPKANSFGYAMTNALTVLVGGTP